VLLGDVWALELITRRSAAQGLRTDDPKWPPQRFIEPALLALAEFSGGRSQRWRVFFKAAVLLGVDAADVVDGLGEVRANVC
jgi:hypothetical protein